MAPARRTVRAAPPTRTWLVVVVALLWYVTLAATGMLGFLVAMAAVWGAASGVSPLLFVLGAIGVAAVGAAVLTGLYVSPLLRRMTPLGRLALLGVLACPWPMLLLAYVWTR